MAPTHFLSIFLLCATQLFFPQLLAQLYEIALILLPFLVDELFFKIVNKKIEAGTGTSYALLKKTPHKLH